MRKLIQSWHALLYLLVLTLISQLVLPSLNKTEVLPFFTWSLFSDYRGHSNQDMRFQMSGETFWLSESPREVLSGLEQHRLWYLIQYRPKSPKIGELVHLKTSSIPGLQVSICTIKTDLPTYILSQTKDRETDCAPL